MRISGSIGRLKASEFLAASLFMFYKIYINRNIASGSTMR